MEQRILVPLDGSEVGEAVLPKLESLVINTSPRKDVKITLLRVISKMNFNVLHEEDAAQLPISESDLKQMTQEAQGYLDKVATRISSKGVSVKTMVSLGHAAEEIVKAARETNANLIAMSTHGRSGIVKWAIGSVTDKVMRLEGQIPVLAVKATDKQDKNSTISMESLQSLMKHS
jgi:nucleotide-binding universal stress UspA family protein